MPFDLASLLDAHNFEVFLGGVAVGSAGTYLADRFTDQRRKSEAINAVNRKFKELRVAMPKLVEEMSTDIEKDESKVIREFVLVPNRSVAFNGSKPRFTYFETDHPNLKNCVELLADAGFVRHVTVHSEPIFRMEEQFVRLLIASA